MEDQAEAKEYLVSAKQRPKPCFIEKSVSRPQGVFHNRLKQFRKPETLRMSIARQSVLRPRPPGGVQEGWPRNEGRRHGTPRCSLSKIS
jgi:hypothetical protein